MTQNEHWHLLFSKVKMALLGCASSRLKEVRVNAIPKGHFFEITFYYR